MLEQQNPLRGVWKFQNQRFIDEIIIVTVLDFGYSEGSQSEQLFIEYKEQLKKVFEQLDILIIAQVVTII